MADCRADLPPKDDGWWCAVTVATDRVELGPPRFNKTKCLREMQEGLNDTQDCEDLSLAAQPFLPEKGSLRSDCQSSEPSRTSAAL